MKEPITGHVARKRRHEALARLPDRSQIAWFRQRLQFWFNNNRRDFPWRSSSDPYVVCLAEIFLQQTSASRVAELIGGFLRRFPDWSSLAEARQEEIENAIFPLGIFKRRAQTLQALANTMIKLDGMPHTRRGLEQLPGIGQYIANVLLVVLYRKRLPFLDINMSRVLERFFGPRKMADIRYDPYLQTLSRRIINTRDSLSANWMILDFAAIVCTKRRPKCAGCPLLERCQHAQETQD